MDALVTIITPNYNAEKFISDTLESVLAQTYTNWEMLIVDDCSNDRSIEIVKKYMVQDERIRLIELEENSGAAVARNRAIEEAKGRFIAFLDSDDLWKPEKLEKQIRFMLEHGYALTYTDYDLIDEENVHYGKTFKAPAQVNYESMLQTCSIGCLTTIYDTEKLGKVYMPHIKKGQDYATWLKILKKIPYAYGLNESLAVYRKRQSSVSSNKFKAIMHQWNIYRKIEKLSTPLSVYYLSHYIYNGLKKYK